jgi:hypothetical protein
MDTFEQLYNSLTADEIKALLKVLGSEKDVRNNIVWAGTKDRY